MFLFNSITRVIAKIPNTLNKIAQPSPAFKELEMAIELQKSPNTPNKL